MDGIAVLGINNGLTLEAIMKMTIGQVVDFAIERYNAEHGDESGKGRPTKRKATQADWDALLG